jgi:NAD-dependent dihydropyrimidine dehydrogenase PreA subunit
VGSTVNPSQCIGKDQCGFCLKECPESAIFVLDSSIRVQINWDLCTNCGKCVPVCPPQALYLFGQAMTVDEVLAEVGQAGGISESTATFSAGSRAGRGRDAVGTRCGWHKRDGGEKHGRSTPMPRDAGE